jgi:hypothetical protein
MRLANFRINRTGCLIRRDWYLPWQHKVAGFIVPVSGGKIWHMEFAGMILTFVSLPCYDLAITWRRRGYGRQFLTELSFPRNFLNPSRCATHGEQENCLFSGIVVTPSGDPLTPLPDGEGKLYAESYRRIGYSGLQTVRDFEPPFSQRVRSLRLHSVDRGEEGVEVDRWATCEDSSMMMGTCRTSIPLLLCAAVAPFLETYSIGKCLTLIEHMEN